MHTVLTVERSAVWLTLAAAWRPRRCANVGRRSRPYATHTGLFTCVGVCVCVRARLNHLHTNTHTHENFTMSDDDDVFWEDFHALLERCSAAATSLRPDDTDTDTDTGTAVADMHVATWCLASAGGGCKSIGMGARGFYGAMCLDARWKLGHL